MRQEPLAPQQGQVCNSGWNLFIKESNRAFDELFMRISLQNREFSLIIVYVGGAGASRVGHDPVYGRHTGVWEKERTVGGAVLSLFLCHKNYIGMAWDGQEGNVPHPTARSYRQYLKTEILIWRFCAGDRNFSLLGYTLFVDAVPFSRQWHDVLYHMEQHLFDFVKISWHIFLKDFVSYAASFRES